MTPESNDFAETLGLREWPFAVVPNPGRALIWAGRSMLLTKLNRMIRRLAGSPHSTLHVLWADFGAGKTHTLLYMRQSLLHNNMGILPIYTGIPREIRSFIDIYRAVVSSVTADELIETYQATKGHPDALKAPPMIGEKWYSVTSVLRALSIGSEAIKESAKKWILADQSLGRQELSAASLPDKIRNDNDAIDAISTLIRLLSLGNRRVMLMLDDFQRVGELRKGKRNDILAGIRTVLNNCPASLTIILSFKFGIATEVKTYLSEELRDVSDPQAIMIPALEKHEAEEFLNDLIEKVRLPGAACRIMPEAVGALIERASTVGTLKPRLLTKTANLLFSEGAMDVSDGVIDSIDAGYIRDRFDELLPAIKGISAEEED